MKKVSIFVTCARGIAPVLVEEIRGLNLPVQDIRPAGVWTRGHVADIMRLNLHLRTGIRVLRKLDRFPACDADALYRHLRRFPWEHHLPVESRLCVTSSVHNAAIRDTRFANLKAKDAICDRLRAETGARPDSGPGSDEAVVFIHWRNREATTFLDTSGISLSRRGYRRYPGTAPMQETLAAAVLLGGGWDPQKPFINPMCGSATLGIEAAMIARRMAPGLGRKAFGLHFLYGFPHGLWEEIRAEAVAGQSRNSPLIHCSDRDRKAIQNARKNIASAGLEDAIELSTCRFEETPLPPPPGWILLNPPYGERMGGKEKLAGLYQEIGNFFKQRGAGFTGVVFSGNLKLMKQVRLKPEAQYTFYNGGIECRLNLYPLYS